MCEELVSYIRVSRKRQERSGLGLEAQRADVDAYAKSKGVPVVREFKEVETGTRKKHRPILAEAIEYATRIGARLVIAKLDRLSRNVLFTATLLESKIDFVACDMPDANKTTIHIFAAIAEDEAERISARTKAALAAAKARGTKLGNPDNLSESDMAKGRALGAKAVADKANNIPDPLVRALREQHAAGRTLQEIANHLNTERFKTPRGGAWSTVQVGRVLDRLGLKRTDHRFKQADSD